MDKEIAITNLDPRLQKQIAAALQAAGQGNPAYAVDVCGRILRDHPNCLEVRKILRAAQMRASGPGKKGLTRWLQDLSGGAGLREARKKVAVDPAAALRDAEAAIAQNPHGLAAHRLLAEAAARLGWSETEVFAWETVWQIEAGGREDGHSLGEAYLRAGRTREAVRHTEQLARQHPDWAEIQELLKKASVAQTLEKGRWEGQGQYREKLRDADEARHLEQQQRSVHEVESLPELLAGARQRAALEPDSMTVRREIIRLLTEMGRLEEALAETSAARHLATGVSDPALARQEGELRLAVAAVGIERLRRAVEQAGPAERAARQTQLEQAVRALQNLKLATAAALVEQYPTDAAARLQYGEALLLDERWSDAAAQLQQASRQTATRGRAFFRLGQAFCGEGKNDLALAQFQAARESGTLSSEEMRELLYATAVCQEHLGRTEEAKKLWQQIYSEDVSFRDVAARLAQYYPPSGRT